MALSGQGQQAATGQASAALNTGTQLADLSTQQGNAITAAREAARNRSSSFFNTLVGAGALALSDIRLKRTLRRLVLKTVIIFTALSIKLIRRVNLLG